MASNPKPLSCPQCGTSYVKRSSRHWPLEHVLSLLYIYPFQCQVCGQRFRAVRWGVRYVSTVEDRRLYERLPVKCAAVIRGQDLEVHGWTSDIALGGCSVEGDGVHLLKGLVGVTLTLPTGTALAIKAASVRSIRGTCIGLQFVEVLPAERRKLSDFIMHLWAQASGTSGQVRPPR